MLKKLLKELYVIAEPTRIKGYTDEQMFEANAANEFTVNMSNLVSNTGVVSADVTGVGTARGYPGACSYN